MPASRYTPPLNATVAAIVALLDDDAREFFEERAGVRQFEGKQDRGIAEHEAMLETLHKFGLKPGC